MARNNVTPVAALRTTLSARTAIDGPADPPGTTTVATPFGTRLLARLAGRPAHAEPGAITIDDVPFIGGLPQGAATATDRMLAGLKKHHVTVMAIVVCRRLGGRAPVVRQWMAAGHQIATHSWSHLHFSDLDLAGFKEQVLRCK